MVVAVTGASGHVGANLCRELFRQGYRVRALLHRDERAMTGLDIEKQHGDVQDILSLEELFHNVDVVFHVAAKISIHGKKNGEIKSINVRGTENVIKACKNSGVNRLIHFSSIHSLEHRPLSQPMDENRPLVTSSPVIYELTKARSEEMVLASSGQKLDTIVLNPSAILGPYDFKPSLMGQVLIKLYNNKLPGLVNGGYDWVDVRDVCDAAITAIHKGKPGQRYILSGKWISIKDIAQTVHAISGKKVTQLVFPLFLVKLGVPLLTIIARISNEDPLYTFGSLKILKINNRNISSDKAKKELDFQPRSIDTTIRDTLEWFMKMGYIVKY